MMFIDMDKRKVCEVIGKNHKFISPFSEPYGYYIYLEQQADQKDRELTKKSMQDLYFNKLKYATENTNALINQVFYKFQSKIDLPKEIWEKLIFESFVLAPDQEEIASCLSNSDILIGHYIECHWDFNWNLIFVCYC